MDKKFGKIFIDGAQGSGKTFLTTKLSSLLGICNMRGIPSNQELIVMPREKIWTRTKDLALVPGNIVYDRSILSIWAYELRKFIDEESKINSIAENILKIISANQNLIFLLLDCDPGTCFLRQSTGLFQSASVQEIKSEADYYIKLIDRIEEVGLPLVLISSEIDINTILLEIRKKLTTFKFDRKD